MTTETQAERVHALAKLTEYLCTGGKREIYWTLTHVSRSGLLRCCRFFIVQDGAIDDISWLLKRISNYTMNDRGIKFTGGNYSPADDVRQLLQLALPGGTEFVMRKLD